MPIVGNRFYNDPAIGAAFNNLAGVFAPPSGSDLSGYASAAATKEKAARLAELFNYAKDPNYKQGMADRMGVLAGLYAPNQSYYSVNLGDQTTRRGQDITASTSMSNNAADNVRALKERELLNLVLRQNNTDDNSRALQQTGIEQEGALARRNAQDAAMLRANDADNVVVMRGQDITADTSLKTNAADNVRALQTNAADNSNAVTLKMLDPVTEGATRYVPPAIADLYKVGQQQSGVISAQPGEELTLPDGRVVRGAPKPLSETEWQAQQNERLRTGGLLTDDMLLDAVVGKNTPVTVLRDGVPTFATPGQATREGMQAFVKPGADAKPVNYRTQDGRQGTAVVGADGKLVDTQTGEVLPPGTVQFSTNVQGDTTQTGIAPTKTNIGDSNKIEAEIRYSLERLKTFREMLAKNPGIAGIPGQIRGFAQDFRSGVQELAAAYGGQVPEVFTSIEQVTALADQIADAKGYDPNIRAAQAMALEMAYADAKAADPSGEVNVKEMERFLNKYDGGLSGNAGVLASLDVLEQSLNARLNTQVQTLRNPGADQTTTADPLEGRIAVHPQTGERRVRRNGKWEPMQ